MKFLAVSEPGHLAAVTGKKFVCIKFSNVNAEGNPGKTGIINAGYKLIEML